MMAIQYAYYNSMIEEKSSDSNFYEITFVGLKRGSDAIISQYNKEDSVECPNHVKGGWYYQPSTGIFISNEEFNKNPEKYLLQHIADSNADSDDTQSKSKKWDPLNYDEEEKWKV